MSELIEGVARGPLVDQEPPARPRSIHRPNSNLPAQVQAQMELADLTDQQLEAELAAVDRELDDPMQGIRRGLGRGESERYRQLSLEAQRRAQLRERDARMEVHVNQRGARGLPDLALLGASDDSRRRAVRDLVEADHRLAEDLMLELQEELGGVDRVVTTTKLPSKGAKS